MNKIKTIGGNNMYCYKCEAIDKDQPISLDLIGYGIKDNELYECYDKTQVDTILQNYIPGRTPEEFDLYPLPAGGFTWFINLREKMLQ